MNWPVQGHWRKKTLPTQLVSGDRRDSGNRKPEGAGEVRSERRAEGFAFCGTCDFGDLRGSRALAGNAVFWGKEETLPQQQDEPCAPRSASAAPESCDFAPSSSALTFLILSYAFDRSLLRHHDGDAMCPSHLSPSETQKWLLSPACADFCPSPGL